MSYIIIDHKTEGEWKIKLIMAINFLSSKDSEETHTMYSKIGNIKILIGSETDGIIEKRFETF